MCCPIRYLDKYLIVLLWCIILIAVIMIHFRINHLTSVYMCVCVCHEPLITATFPPPPLFLVVTNDVTNNTSERLSGSFPELFPETAPRQNIYAFSKMDLCDLEDLPPWSYFYKYCCISAYLN